MASRSELRGLRSAVDAEEAVIQGDPRLLWPQLHRRLRWSSTTEVLLARWSDERSGPWLRPRTRAGLEDSLIGTISAGHGPIVDIDQLSDGSLLTAARSIRRWDLRDRTMLGEIETGATSIAAHPLELLVASVDRWGRVSVWSADSGTLVAAEADDGERAGGCAWSPDGRLLATTVDDLVVVWAFADGRLQCAWRGVHLEPVRDVCFSPDGRFIVSGGSDPWIRVWRAGGGEEVRRIKPIASDATFSVRATPDGSAIVVGGYSGRVTLYDLASGEATMAFREHTRWALDIDVTGDGSTAVSAGEDGTVRTYDLKAGEPGPVLSGHTTDVKACSVLDGGPEVATAGRDGTVRLWDLGRAGPDPVPGHEERVRGCALSPDRSWVVTAGVDDYVRSWDVGGGDPSAERLTRSRWLDIAVSGSDAVAAVYWSGSIEAWSSDLSEQVARIDGKYLAIGGTRKRFAAVGSRLTVFDARSWSEIASAEESGTAIAPAAGGQWLTADAEGRVLLWDRDLSRHAEVGDHGARVTSCAMAPSGRRAVTSGADWTVRLWAVEERRELAAFELPVSVAERRRCRDLMVGFTHEAEKPGATACRFMGEDHVVVGALDGSICVWNVAAGTQVAALMLGQPILCLDADDEGLVVAGDAMGGVHLLDLVGV